MNGNGNGELFNLASRKALITGSPDALGRAIAIALVSSGAEVAINYSSPAEGAAQVASYIDNIGVQTWVYPADLSNLAHAEQMRRRLTKRFGHIDILVNNAGIDFYRLFKGMTEKTLEQVISANMDAALNSINLFMNDLQASEHGRIINITSSNGGGGLIGEHKYASAKAGIISLTRTLATQLAAKNVTVNAISPGFLETEASAALPPKLMKEILSKIPARRLGRVDDIARAVAFLASDSSDYITGQVLNINGGMHL